MCRRREAYKHLKDEVSCEQIVQELGDILCQTSQYGFFIGVSKSTDKASFYAAIEDAFYTTQKFYRKAVVGRELSVQS